MSELNAARPVTDPLVQMQRQHMRKIQRLMDDWATDCLAYKVRPIDGKIGTRVGGDCRLLWDCNLDAQPIKRVSCRHCGQFIEPLQTCPELDGYEACEPEQ